MVVVKIVVGDGKGIGVGIFRLDQFLASGRRIVSPADKGLMINVSALKSEQIHGVFLLADKSGDIQSIGKKSGKSYRSANSEGDGDYSRVLSAARNSRVASW